MINFFSGKPASSTKPATTSNGVRASSASASSSTATVAQPPLKKTKLAPAPPITVVTTVKKKVAPPPTAHPRDPIAALSGYSKNALPEEKRRRIIDERLASQRQKSIETSLEAQLRAPVKSPSKLKAAGSSSKRSAASASKPKPKKPRKKVVDSDSEDDDFGGYGHSSRNASSGPSTPRGSKRASVDPHPISDSYQKVGREGVLPNYTVARNILAASFTSTNPTSAAALDNELSTPISSADIVTSNIKSYGPYFNGLGDAPRATLEYPGANAREEFLLLVPKDTDEYDPLMELLATVRTIVTHYLTDDQREAFGTLDSLQVSNNAGMILPSAANGTHSTTTSSNAAAALVGADSINGTRAKSADLLDGQGSKAERRDELIGSQLERDAGSKTPEPHVNGISQTAPVSPTSHTGSIGASTGGSSVAKTVLINNALLRLDSPAPTESSLASDFSSTFASPSATDPDSILRSFTKARNRRDGPLFMRTLSRFNNALAALRDSGALSANITALGTTTGVPEGIWRLIQDQVYARIVGPRVEELGRYQAFSDNVYGELLPRFMSEIAQLTSLGPNKVFVDLGSGVGNLLIQTSLQTGAEAYGCEMMPIPAALASQQIIEAQSRWASWGLCGGGAVEAWQGDFGEHTGVRDVLKRADVVLVNNYAFLPKTNENLSLLFLDLPDGAQIVSLKPFVPPDFRLTQRTLSSPLAILRVTERLYTSGCVSWADGGGKYYIQTVDRSLVREFLEAANGSGAAGKRGRGKGKVDRGDSEDMMVGQDVRRKRWKAAVDDDDEDEDEDEV